MTEAASHDTLLVAGGPLDSRWPCLWLFANVMCWCLTGAGRNLLPPPASPNSGIRPPVKAAYPKSSTRPLTRWRLPASAAFKVVAAILTHATGAEGHFISCRHFRVVVGRTGHAVF